LNDTISLKINVCLADIISANPMSVEPYQKSKQRENRNNILYNIDKTGEFGIRFMNLKREVGLPKSVVWDHLHELQSGGDVAKFLRNGRPHYRTTDQGRKKRGIQPFTFGEGCIYWIQRELDKERQASFTKIRGIWTLEDSNSQFIANKSESGIIEAVSKWLTPIVLWTIMLEWKTGNEWTKAVHSVIKELFELIKQKDKKNFEEALIAKYKEEIVHLEEIRIWMGLLERD